MCSAQIVLELDEYVGHQLADVFLVEWKQFVVIVSFFTFIHAQLGSSDLCEEQLFHSYSV